MGKGKAGIEGFERVVLCPVFFESPGSVSTVNWGHRQQVSHNRSLSRIGFPDGHEVNKAENTQD